MLNEKLTLIIIKRILTIPFQIFNYNRDAFTFFHQEGLMIALTENAYFFRMTFVKGDLFQCGYEDVTVNLVPRS